MTTRVTVWNEHRHELKNPAVAAIYPHGIHGAIAACFRQQPDLAVQTATLSDPDHGLTDAVLAETDVLVWWGHLAHHEVKDEVVQKVYARVLTGMGLIVLHSGHFSKIFRKLMGTSCDLRWRDDGETERLWVVNPAHPIAAGLDPYFELEREEMYGEFFDIPAPDSLVLVSWFKGGEVFRSGCCYERGLGRIFYFRPGHETFPTYHNAHVQRVLVNAVRWAAPVQGPAPRFGNAAPLEPIQ